ncbi:MAG: TonB-dependent receptor [Proteobacteria bacterium]|nr:TonB-dependent receptor [Pseudomonadota bacterium]
MSQNYRHPLLTLAVAGALATSAVAAAEDKGLLEEIVVTAQKREVSLQKVPFSVAAVTEEQIRSSGAQNIVDLSRNVSGLIITDLGPGQSQVAIRGISAGQVIRDQPGVKPAVGMYLDESSIAVALFTPDLDLYDLERVEVLRGPQGTIFGSGSETGTVRYITSQPKLGLTEGSYQLDLSKVSGGGVGGDAKGAINFPLGDNAAARIVAYQDWIPGFIKAYGPNGSVDNNVNRGTKSGARVAVTWKPNDQLTITPRFVYQDLQTDGFPRTDVYNILGNPYTTTEPAVPLGDRTQYRQLREGINDNFRLGDVKIVYDFGPAALTSITSFLNRDVLVTRDATQLTGSVTYQFGGTSADIRTSSPLLDHTDLQSFSQEIRVGSQGKQTVDWLVGAYYEHYRKAYGQDLPTPGYDAIAARLLCGPTPTQACITGVSGPGNGAPVDEPFYSNLHYSFEQIAAFAEATWHLNDVWAATAGARVYSYDENRTLVFGGLFAVPQGPVPGSVRASGAAPRGILSWDVTSDVRLNLQASKGFRLGGINDPLNATICSPSDLSSYSGHPTWNNEGAWNYELGAKMRFLDRRVTFNVSAFYTDIKDLQVPVDAGSCSSRVVFNVPKARSQGLEAELFARPTQNWDFSLTATYADATLQSTVTDSSGAPIPGLVSGNRLATSPKLQAAASVGFTLPGAIHGTWDYFAVATGQYVGASWRSVGDEQPGYGTVPSSLFFAFGNPTISSFSFNPELDAYHIVNFRTGFRAGNTELAAFVNNVTDESAHLSLDVERGRRARVGYLTNQPRTFGLSVSQKF